MTTTPIQNQPATAKNWQAVINSVKQSDQQTRSSAIASATPQAPHSAPSVLPSRAAPNAADGPLLAQGLDNISSTDLLFSIETLVRLMFKLALEQRNVRRISRMQDANAAESMGQAAAADLRDEAAMSVSGATVMASMQVVGSATVIGGGISTAKNTDTMAVTNKMMQFQAASQTFGATGQMAQGGFNYEVHQDEANKALHDASATRIKSLEEIESDDAKGETQLIQSIIQMQQKQEESRHEAVRATA